MALSPQIDANQEVTALARQFTDESDHALTIPGWVASVQFYNLNPDVTRVAFKSVSAEHQELTVNLSTEAVRLLLPVLLEYEFMSDGEYSAGARFYAFTRFHLPEFKKKIGYRR